MNFNFALKLTVFAPGAEECGPFFLPRPYLQQDVVTSIQPSHFLGALFQWRIAVGLVGVPSIVCFTILFTIAPESPAWLISRL